MSDDLVKRLREDAKDHRAVAHEADCDPKKTVNWHHAENADAAADRIEKLERALEKIAVHHRYNEEMASIARNALEGKDD